MCIIRIIASVSRVCNLCVGRQKITRTHTMHTMKRQLMVLLSAIQYHGGSYASGCNVTPR